MKISLKGFSTSCESITRSSGETLKGFNISLDEITLDIDVNEIKETYSSLTTMIQQVAGCNYKESLSAKMLHEVEMEEIRHKGKMQLDDIRHQNEMDMENIRHQNEMEELEKVNKNN